MSARNVVETAISDALIDEAADWLVRLHAGELDADGKQALDAWCQRSPQHRRLWIAAQQLVQTFGRVPADLGMPVLQREVQRSERPRLRRRAVVKSLAMLVAAAPAGWLALEQLPAWRATLRTGVGERRDVTLADGSRLWLNTDSAVDVQFDAKVHAIRLHAGEIVVETVASSEPLLQVQTAQGSVQAVQGSFAVRQHEASSTVQAMDAAVTITPRHSARPHRASVGQRIRFTDNAWHDERTALDAIAWLRGELIASDMRLDQFVAELSRYRPGVLRCDPAVASRRISGVFQLDDTDRVLAVLRQTLPVTVQYRTRYWVTVTAV